ncbi:hypothetical protein M433DRAFT_151314 [Acidomyces richmondensis BFW]|nr:MAG: hypothetical protein FE78DRAFT_85248 [Acidomyces sp. 'richmondensis']KYG48261.1 hypothetical protein M433DRAFT_151314 [Acidomyces richmondensis BFW]
MPYMPPKPGSTISWLAWQCPQCNFRSFSTSSIRAAVGPEHPRYLDLPEPPQQTLPDRHFIKGRLPVPRNVFDGAEGRDKASNEFLEPHTKPPKRPSKAPIGSREQWKERLSELRRRNLREGLATLRARQDQEAVKQRERQRQQQEERARLLNAAEREDERLTAPSHNLDLAALARPPTDPTRAERLAHKELLLAAHTAAKSEIRHRDLHALYMRARSFIVTQEQLDAEIERAFGTAENPVSWAGYGGDMSANSASVWALGPPASVKDLAERNAKMAGDKRSGSALDTAGGFEKANQERLKRIAEVLTGGEMGRD